MANECYFDAIVSGRKDNVNRFIDIITGTDKEMKMMGIYQAELCDIIKEVGLMCTAEVYGYCRWSVCSCMTDSPKTYFDDYSKNIRKHPERYVNEEKYFTHLNELCNILDINIQIYGEEPGFAFCEYYEFSPNENPKEEVGKYEVWNLEDAETYEQCKSIYSNEYKNCLKKDENGDIIMPFSKEQFDEVIKEKENILVISDFTFEDKYHDVLDEMIPKTKQNMIRLIDKDKEPYKPMREYWKDIEW